MDVEQNIGRKKKTSTKILLTIIIPPPPPTIIILIIIIIAMKGAFQDFLQSPHCAANCLQHMRSSGQGPIVCKSRAAHRARITWNMSCATWYEQLSY